MNSKEIFDGVIKGCFFGLAGMYAVAGLVCSAGLMSSLTPAYGTNYLVTAIVFYGIPGVIDRIDRYFGEKVNVKSVPENFDVYKFFAKETSYPGIGVNNRSIPLKKKKMRKTVSKKIK